MGCRELATSFVNFSEDMIGEHMTTGFTQKTVDFLSSLRDNNTKDWFAAHRADYETFVKQPAAEFSESLQEQLAELTGIEHGAKILRIFRDLRFSKDKTPYNTFVRMALYPDTGGTPPAWMFGIDPDGVTIGVGIMQFEKPQLESYRNLVAGASGEALQATLDSLEPLGVRCSEPELKRVPRGFDAEHPRAEHLRRKGLVVWSDLGKPRQGLGRSGIERSMSRYEKLLPVFEWLMPLA